MEITRHRVREQTLDRFKHIRTCVLARELCLLIRTNRVSLDPTDVRECCAFVTTLCQEAGCDEPSDLCRKAADVVLTSEEDYLNLCTQSCQICGESRRPASQRPQIRERNIYVA